MPVAIRMEKEVRWLQLQVTMLFISETNIQPSSSQAPKSSKIAKFQKTHCGFSLNELFSLSKLRVMFWLVVLILTRTTAPLIALSASVSLVGARLTVKLLFRAGITLLRVERIMVEMETLAEAVSEMFMVMLELRLAVKDVS